MNQASFCAVIGMAMLSGTISTLPRLPRLPRSISPGYLEQITHGHLNILGGRELYKFDHLDKTKDLAATGGQTWEQLASASRALRAKAAWRILVAQSA
jgi:hypothetical protein